MNATKRKFNTLLNGLGNKSSTSLNAQDHTIVPAAIEPEVAGDQSAKKRRIIPARVANIQKSTMQNIERSSSIKLPNAHKKSASIASSALPEEAPTYAPWDRNAFLERLKTFSNLTDWTDKPPRVNEVEWAKRGWICKGFERVRCCSCNVELLVKLNKKEGDEGKEEYVFNAHDIEQALVDKYAEMIITSHAESCLWRQRGCDDSIFKLPLNNPAATLKALRERYDSLDSLKDSLPYMHNMHPPTDLNLDEVLSYLPSDFFVSEVAQAEAANPLQVNRVAFMMALFGWQRRPAVKYRDGACWCPVCFRTLGLWLFKSKKVNDNGEEIEKATVPFLDPFLEHRFYCPWKSAESQNGGKVSASSPSPELAAWQVVIRVLKNDFILRQGRENETRKSLSGPRAPDVGTPASSIFGGDLESEDARSVREQKDKERWARLRRVKSLFDTKAGKKLQRPGGPHKDPAQG